ncbi:MerR family transcriptional regulator [Streptomyces inusitatus]|uniref:MerR family transcriptional regulator n=1 Tax=Streptomyces inusitatus TaxID=68221 RepID=A0A918UP41_9ACTN|nr:MerR family transcriptional regulator [Streptomyces inusitatus]GGZ24268.1 MerR family transcriptional regulator [Streptomyces inusitatus]
MPLRPIDLAREHGLSTQAVRNYEEAGILPPAGRTPSGYRVYGPRHATALRAFLALVPAHGHATAAAVMRAVHGGAVEDALRLIDESHAQLAGDRDTLAAVEQALRDLEPADGPEPEPEPDGPETGAVFIGPLAHRLGLRPATLRAWERAGLVVPRRDPRTGYRVYTSADVRDVLLAHQLRRGGYGLERIALVLERVRTAGGPEPLRSALREWRDRLTARGLAMLAGAAALDACLGQAPTSDVGRQPPR